MAGEPGRGICTRRQGRQRPKGYLAPQCGRVCRGGTGGDYRDSQKLPKRRTDEAGRRGILPVPGQLKGLEDDVFMKREDMKPARLWEGHGLPNKQFVSMSCRRPPNRLISVGTAMNDCKERGF